MSRAARYWYWSSAITGLLGILLILAALVRYTSWSNTRVLGRWSETHFSIIALFVVIFSGILFRVWKERSYGIRLSAQSLVVRCSSAVGIFIWAVSFFLDSVEDPRAGGRITDLVFFGSYLPASMLLEWVSMAFLFVAFMLAMGGGVQRRFNMASPAYRHAQNYLLMLISLGAILLLLEGGTRLLNVVRPMTQGFPSKSSALWERHFVRVNSLGYRDSEHAMRPPERTKRILLVGDSVTLGAGIQDPEQRLGDRLENGLNHQAGGMRLEVINAGKPDTHTLDHIEALQRMLLYQPDYVFLIYVFNDIEHVTKPVRSVATDIRRPWDRVHPLRLLVLNSHFAEQIFVRVRKGLYQYLWDENEAVRSDPYRIESIVEPHLQALDRFFKLCQEAKVEARLIPFDIEVQLRESSMARYDAFVKRLIARHIPVWSLAEAFRGHKYADLTVNGLDGHPNALANQLAAEVIIERFQAESLKFGAKVGGEKSSTA